MLHASVVSRTPSLMSRLREATAGVREDREFLIPGTTELDYRAFLVRMYCFHAALERALGSSRQLAQVLPDAPLRNHKAALLAADLVALGVDRRDLIRLPRMAFPGALPLPEALGWTYVVESAVLGGKQQVRRLTRHIPNEIRRAAAYLGCYGDEAQERWRELGDALDSFEHADRDGDRVIAAAREGFTRLRAWMAPAVPPRSTRIHA